jgi:protein-arginine kinase activator protein McsA
MLCYRCNKNIAVIYLNSLEGDKPMNRGLCLKCARELKIANIDQLMETMAF